MEFNFRFGFFPGCNANGDADTETDCNPDYYAYSDKNGNSNGYHHNNTDDKSGTNPDTGLEGFSRLSVYRIRYPGESTINDPVYRSLIQLSDKMVMGFR